MANLSTEEIKIYDFPGTVAEGVVEPVTIHVDYGDQARPMTADALSDEAATFVLRMQGIADPSGELARLCSLTARVTVGRMMGAKGLTAIYGSEEDPNRLVQVDLRETDSRSKNLMTRQGEQ